MVQGVVISHCMWCVVVLAWATVLVIMLLAGVRYISV